MRAITPGEERFWSVAEPFLARDGVTRSTMMGFPCLRVGGAFFASCDHRRGDLLVKLPAERVGSLVADGGARPFAPAGRTFREWAAVPPESIDSWEDLIGEALAFVGGLR